MKIVLDLSFLILFSMQFKVIAQSFEKPTKNKGIEFQKGLSWEQVKSKAKMEKKSIFVDCFATWCNPCKLMDKKVYSNDSVGNYVNDRFISIKLQMDSTKFDDPNTQSLYQVAKTFKNDFNIVALPTYLFFSENGDLVHKEVGARTVRSFINMISDAINTDKQAYGLLDSWRKGKLSYEMMPNLANKLRQLRENELAYKVIEDYMRNYLDGLSEKEFLKRENVELLGIYNKVINSNDRIFKYYYNQADKIDGIVSEKGFSSNKVSAVIYREEIFLPYFESYMKKGVDTSHVQIRWEEMKKRIAKKYSRSIAERNVVEAQIIWYKFKREFKHYATALVSNIDRVGYKNVPNGGFGQAVYLNMNAWEVFKYSDKKSELKQALKWVTYAISLKADPQNIDTKANLLFKLGRRKDAIAMVEELIKKSSSSVYRETLNKMKMGTPTW